MKKVYIYTLSCRRRSLDANKISDYLFRNGHEIVYKPKDADIIIFFTCAFIDKRVESSLDKIREFQKYDAELIVAGCLPAIDEKKLAEIFNGKTICTKDIDEIYRLFPEKKVKFSEIDDANSLYENTNKINFIQVVKKTFRNIGLIESSYIKIKDYILKKIFGETSFIYNILLKRPFLIRISWGCFGNCTYCSIKKAIGPYKSKSLERCIDEVKKGLKQGFNQFLLTADDAGAYGLDLGSNFPELLENIINIKEEFKVGVESLNPVWLVKYFDDLRVSLLSTKIQYIDCAVQSGSNKILKVMNRYPNVEKMTEALLEVKRSNPNLLLTTEVIIGFPGETEEDFHQTLSFLKKVQFNAGFIYQFACKTGTEAENIEPKVPREDILRRCKSAKNFLKNEGYKVFYLAKKDCLLFEKRSNIGECKNK